MHDLRTQIATLAKTFAPDPRLDLPVQSARTAAKAAREELDRAKVRLDQVARNYQPGTDRSALDSAEREVTKAYAMLRSKLDACTKAVSYREMAHQKAALAAFEKAQPAIAELVELMNELSEALKPLADYAAQRDISSTQALANFPALRIGVDALRGMARQ